VSEPVLGYFGRFGEAMLSVLQAAMPEVEVVACAPDGTPPVAGEVLATLAYDGAGLEHALVPSVRWVHALGTGVDGFPFHLLGDRVLTCSRGASATAISEWVMAVMLAFEKQLPQSWITEPPEHWNLAGLGGVRGKTVGLVGFGAIGGEVARRALPFDMRVIAFRRTGTPPHVAGVEVAASLSDLLGQSDHVVVAAPATPDTFHLLDAAAFGAVKPGAHLVNVARGTLIDQDALLAALDDGRVAVASLDVVDPEPLPAGHPLYSHPRVRLSPHISWSSPDTMPRTFDLFAENLRRWRAGEPLQGIVDPDAGY
jgi:phosphoglycerate dehydrogenase-like enzyme